MLRTRVIPCLLLKDSGLVKTRKFKNPVYLGDPINAVKIFNDKGSDELIFLDITATKEKRKPSFDFIKEIATECFMPFSYGGGIRSLDDAKRIISSGAEKVIINSYAVENPSFITKLAKYFGKQSIVVSIDYQNNFLGRSRTYTHGGKKSSGIHPLQFAKKMEEAGAGEIMLTSIERESSMKGYDLTLINTISKELSIPVIASGGAGTLEDFGNAKVAGASALSAGSFFVFQGIHRAYLINYPSSDKWDQVMGIEKPTQPLASSKETTRKTI
jgi:imidazole glycerol-phosphate synthase subunit HisF